MDMFQLVFASLTWFPKHFCSLPKNAVNFSKNC